MTANMGKGSYGRIIATLLLMLFVGYVSSTILFPHTHIVDGRKVSHSHPYSGTSQSPKHSHSTNQMLSIENLSLLLAFIVTALRMVVFRSEKYPIAVCDIYENGRTLTGIRTMRGPPHAAPYLIQA